MEMYCMVCNATGSKFRSGTQYLESMQITAHEFLVRTMVLEVSSPVDEGSRLCEACFQLITGCDCVHQVFKHNVKTLLDKRGGYVSQVHRSDVQDGDGMTGAKNGLLDMYSYSAVNAGAGAENALFQSLVATPNNRYRGSNGEYTEAATDLRIPKSGDDSRMFFNEMSEENVTKLDPLHSPGCDSVSSHATRRDSIPEVFPWGAPTRVECTMCSHSAPTQSHIVVHMQIVHNQTFVLPCPACEQVFAAMEDLDAHKMAHHDDEVHYRCHHCCNSFWSKKAILDHVSSLEEVELSHVCEACGEILPPSVYRQHVISVTRASSKRKADLANDDSEWRVSTPTKTWPCPSCDRSFSQEDYLSMRYATHVADHFTPGGSGSPPPSRVELPSNQTAWPGEDPRFLGPSLPPPPPYRIPDIQGHHPYATHQQLGASGVAAGVTARDSYNCDHCHQVFYTRDDYLAHLEYLLANPVVRDVGKVMSPSHECRRQDSYRVGMKRVVDFAHHEARQMLKAPAMPFPGEEFVRVPPEAMEVQHHHHHVRNPHVADLPPMDIPPWPGHDNSMLVDPASVSPHEGRSLPGTPGQANGTNASNETELVRIYSRGNRFAELAVHLGVSVPTAMALIHLYKPYDTSLQARDGQMKRSPTLFAQDSNDSHDVED